MRSPFGKTFFLAAMALVVASHVSANTLKKLPVSATVVESCKVGAVPNAPDRNGDGVGNLSMACTHGARASVSMDPAKFASVNFIQLQSRGLSQIAPAQGNALDPSAVIVEVLF